MAKHDTKTLGGALDDAARTTGIAAVDLFERCDYDIALLVNRPTFDVDQFGRVLRTVLGDDPLLGECDPHALLGALVSAAMLDLVPLLDHAYLIPGKPAVRLLIGYRGYVDLAYRSGAVKDVAAELVYDGDLFKVTKGTAPRIVHVDAGAPGDRGIVAAYAVARLRTGGTVSRVIYPSEWEDAQKQAKRGPWLMSPGSMICATAIRQLVPWLPQSDLLTYAASIDGAEALRLDDLLAETGKQ